MSSGETGVFICFLARNPGRRRGLVLGRGFEWLSLRYPRSDRWNWGWDVSDEREGAVGGDALTGESTWLYYVVSGFGMSSHV